MLKEFVPEESEEGVVQALGCHHDGLHFGWHDDLRQFSILPLIPSMLIQDPIPIHKISKNKFKIHKFTMIHCACECDIFSKFR